MLWQICSGESAKRGIYNPSIFDKSCPSVSKAVEEAAYKTGVAAKEALLR